MQVSKTKALEKVQANIDLLSGANKNAREENINAVDTNVEALVDHVVQGTPCPVVTIKIADTSNLSALQAFAELIDVLAPDGNGDITITESQYDRYVRDQASVISTIQVKLTTC